ncbi:hypothetical protein FS749_004826 [Ceratobasidium sp. UAMH 11750]|nr:hypothetical protein FS749_004826 [Ceratobasidium sp. UAMH 11750]
MENPGPKCNVCRICGERARSGCSKCDRARPSCDWCTRHPRDGPCTYPDQEPPAPPPPPPPPQQEGHPPPPEGQLPPPENQPPPPEGHLPPQQPDANRNRRHDQPEGHPQGPPPVDEHILNRFHEEDRNARAQIEARQRDHSQERGRG